MSTRTGCWVAGLLGWAVVVAGGCGGAGLPRDGGATRDDGATRDVQADAPPPFDAGEIEAAAGDAPAAGDTSAADADAAVDAPATGDTHGADADAALDTPTGDAVEAGGPMACGTGDAGGGDARTDAASGTFAEFPLPVGSISPYFITSGHGKLWFTGGDTFQLFSTITTDGCLTDYLGSRDPLTASASAMTFAPDGNVWFIQTTLSQVGHVAPDGSSLWVLDLPFSTLPVAITLGPDGNIWFASYGTNAIGRITLDGVFTSFPTPTPDSAPVSLTNGPGGRLWFSERGRRKIGSIDPATGTIVELSLPDGSTPGHIVFGPDGNLWFINYLDPDGYSVVSRLTPGGTFTDFPIPGDIYMREITVGPDGNIWLTEQESNKLTRLSLSNGAVTEYTVPTPDSQPTGITAGPDGNIWFTEYRGKIGRLTP